MTSAKVLASYWRGNTYFWVNYYCLFALIAFYIPNKGYINYTIKIRFFISIRFEKSWQSVVSINLCFTKKGF